jgi:hypothetical protein
VAANNIQPKRFVSHREIWTFHSGILCVEREMQEKVFDIKNVLMLTEFLSTTAS